MRMREKDLFSQIDQIRYSLSLTFPLETVSVVGMGKKKLEYTSDL